jgi:hypothetical protein
VSELGNWARELGRPLAIALACGVLLALLGPFGSFAAPLPRRLLFWVALLLAGAVCEVLLRRALSRRPSLGSNPVVRWAFLTVAIGAPMALLSWGLGRTLFGAGAPAGFLFFLWASLLITGAVTALMSVLNTPGPATEGAAGKAIRLRERLPPQLRSAEIFAASSEDHYLRVHTSAGSSLILLRLSDAITELDGIEGAQVHRSWWVARTAITGARRDGRNLVLLLKGGIEAPVSRPNVAVLKETGWI